MAIAENYETAAPLLETYDAINAALLNNIKSDFTLCRPPALERFHLSRVLWALSMVLSFAGGVVIMLAKPCNRNDPTLAIYSPAHEAVEYQTVVADRGFKVGLTAYQGWPSDELDARWASLYKSQYFEIETWQKAKLPNNTIRWPQVRHRDKWMIGISVMHELHCLDKLRMALHPLRYNLSIYNVDGSPDQDNFDHIDHCLDLVREAIMCHSDTSAFVFTWHPIHREIRLRADTPHTCRNFQKIKAWANRHEGPQREFDIHKFFAEAGDQVPLDFGP